MIAFNLSFTCKPHRSIPTKRRVPSVSNILYNCCVEFNLKFMPLVLNMNMFQPASKNDKLIYKIEKTKITAFKNYFVLKKIK